MTTKEIAGATGKDDTAVRRWARKLAGESPAVAGKIAASTSAHPADYSVQETCAMIEIGLGKNAADLFRMNAETYTKPVGQHTANAEESRIEARLDRLENIAEKLLMAVGNLVMSSQPQGQRMIGNTAPPLDSRSNIVKTVNEYVAKTGTPHRDAYTNLYREYGYRTHCNAILSAKNRNMKIIDYIDSEGQIEILEAVALEIFK